MNKSFRILVHVTLFSILNGETTLKADNDQLLNVTQIQHNLTHNPRVMQVEFFKDYHTIFWLTGNKLDRINIKLTSDHTTDTLDYYKFSKNNIWGEVFGQTVKITTPLSFGPPPIHLLFNLSLLTDPKIQKVHNNDFYNITGLIKEKNLNKWLNESDSPIISIIFRDIIFDSAFIDKYDGKEDKPIQLLKKAKAFPLNAKFVYTHRGNCIISLNLISAQGELVGAGSLGFKLLDPETNFFVPPTEFIELTSKEFKTKYVRQYFETVKEIENSTK